MIQSDEQEQRERKKVPRSIIQHEYQRVFKILVIGDGGVGKTSLIRKYVDNKFSETYVSTIGIDFKEKIITVNKRKIKLQIWDTAGQERFHTITKAYYRGAQGLIITFDVTDLLTFHHLQYWLQHISQNYEDKAQKVIVGTKQDLFEQRKIEISKIAALCEETGFRFIQVSSKTGKNIQVVFQTLINLIFQHCEETRQEKIQNLSLSSKGFQISFKRKKCEC